MSRSDSAEDRPDRPSRHRWIVAAVPAALLVAWMLPPRIALLPAVVAGVAWWWAASAAEARS